MLQIVLGNVGFRWEIGKKAEEGEKRQYASFILAFGIVAFIWWSGKAREIYMKALRLGLGDAERIANAEKYIDEQAKQRTMSRHKDLEERYRWYQEMMDDEREKDTKTKTELRKRVRDLEGTVNVLMERERHRGLLSVSVESPVVKVTPGTLGGATVPGCCTVSTFTRATKAWVTSEEEKGSGNE